MKIVTKFLIRLAERLAASNDRKRAELDAHIKALKDR